MATQSNAQPAETGSNPFLKLVAALSTLSGWVAAGMIVLAVLITCQMIFVRFVLNHSTIWQTEAVVYLMISATLVGLPYVQRLRGHVNVDLLPLMLPKVARRILAIITLLASLAIVGLMFFYGFEFWYEAWSRNWKSDTVWGVRLWIPYLAMPVGFGLFLLQLIADLLAVISGIDRPFGLQDNR
ncbi:MAG: TRAP transporter small permease [Stappiaceae bacterium]